MSIRLLEIAKEYQASRNIDRPRMAALYRPLVRGACAVTCVYYAIVGLLISPFLESSHVTMVLTPARLSAALLAGLAFYFTRKTTDLGRLEIASLLVSLHIFGNYVLNENTLFQPQGLFNFEVMVVLYGATSPSLRVLLLAGTASIGAWLWLVVKHHPDILRINVFMAIVAAVMATLIWSLIHAALRSAAAAIAKAEAHSHELERFAYVCSHDMHEPVRMMNSYAALLASDPSHPLGEDSQRYANLIQGNALRLKQMISGILTYLDIGREPLRLERVDGNQIIAEVIAKFQPEIVEWNAQIVCAGLPWMQTNPALLRMLFETLIGNALLYQDKARPPEIAITALEEKTRWRFEIKDNGIGIDPAHKINVFTLFQRLNRKEDYPGAGIALATFRKFLQYYGGDLDFNSRPGAGSTFFFHLPRLPPKQDGAH